MSPSLGGTSDGISPEDWSRVHELVVDLFNSPSEAKDAARNLLFQWLDELERKYGELPSIVATRADFVDDDRSREELLHRAYSRSETLNDRVNLLQVAHSLAEFYIDQAKNAVSGRQWLDAFKNHLTEIEDEYYRREYRRMLRGLNGLPGPWSR